DTRTHTMDELKEQLNNPVPRRVETPSVSKASYSDSYVDEPNYEEEIPTRSVPTQPTPQRRPSPVQQPVARATASPAPAQEDDISPYKYGIMSGLIGFVVLGLIALICIHFIVLPMIEKRNAENTHEPELYVSSQEDVSSNDEDLVEVPNLTNLNWEDVDGNEEYADFYIRLTAENYDEKHKEGTIIAQTVKPGTKVARNTPIGVIVSKGSKMRVVPDIIGMTVSEASAALEEAGLLLGDQAEEYNDEYEMGKIIRLNGIEVGKKIQEGSMINVVVSLGEE
ncbi:MAG: PASTA domain-containing protein, partial [Clostridia bacterium]|nr:PASTA domain-containing protein [Clostridia bacterium]